MSTATTSPSANYVGRILAGLARDPEKTAFHLPTGTTLSHAEFGGLVHRMAYVLAHHGVGHGITVTFLSRNRADTLAVRYAANLLGARVAFLYEGLAAEAQAAILSDVDTRLLVVDAELAERVNRILELARVGTVLTLGPAVVGSDLLAMADAAPSSAVSPHPVSPAEPWCIRHTGGTTGHPKGIVMVHGGQQGFLDTITRIVGVDVGDGAARGRAFLHHHRWRFPNLRDGTAGVARRYGVKDPRTLPVTFALDRSGHIAATLRGPLTASRIATALRAAR